MNKPLLIYAVLTHALHNIILMLLSSEPIRQNSKPHAYGHKSSIHYTKQKHLGCTNVQG